MLVRVVEAEDMPEFMQRDPREINDGGAPWSRIGSPRKVIIQAEIKHNIRLNDFAAGEERRNRYGQDIGRKIHAALGGRKS